MVSTPGAFPTEIIDLPDDCSDGTLTTNQEHTVPRRSYDEYRRDTDRSNSITGRLVDLSTLEGQSKSYTELERRIAGLGKGSPKTSNSKHMRQKSAIKEENMADAETYPSIEDFNFDMDSVVADGSGYPGNEDNSPFSQTTTSTSQFHPTPRRHRGRMDDIIMDNDRNPTRPDFGTPVRHGSADEDSLFLPDDTPSRKRRRNDDGSYQRLPPPAPMTPSSTTRRSTTHRTPSSSGLFSTQARSQLSGAHAFSFNGTPQNLTPRHNTAVVTQADLQQMMAELTGVVNQYKAATDQVLNVAREFSKLREDVNKLNRDIDCVNKHMNDSFKKMKEGHKEAIKEINDKQEEISHELDDMATFTGKDDPVRGGAFGGGRLSKKDGTPGSGLFAGLINPDPQRTPAPAPQGPSRGGT